MAKKKQDEQPEIIDVKEEKKNSSKKENFINYLKDLGLSIVKTKNLFRFAIRHWITPLIVFIVVTLLLTIPQFINNATRTGDEVIQGTGILYSDKVISHALSQDLKCKVENGKLKCDEGFSYVETYEFTNEKTGKNVAYDIYVNAADTINTRDDDGYFEVKDFAKEGDNYVAFYEESFIIRYVSRNSDTGDYLIYKMYGFYTQLESLDLSEVYSIYTQKAEAEKEEYLDYVSDSIIALGFDAATSERQFIELSSNLLSYIILLLIVALLIKGNFMLNRKKGLKYSQSFKIAIMASLQSCLIALALSLFNFNIVNVFGLALTIRTLYLWLRYTASRSNTTWLNDLYEYSKDDRFLLDATTKK